MPQPSREEYKARRAERGRQQEARAPKPWYWFRQRDPVARFTLYVGFFTLALVAVGLLQWCSIRGQLTEMRSGGIDAQNTKRLDQRAWLGIDGIAGSAIAGQSFAEVVHIRNSGKTPAIKMRFYAGLERGRLLPDARKYCAMALKENNRGIVAPQASYSIPKRADEFGKLSGDWSRDFAGDEMYVVGCVLYDDIFDQPHWLTYCGRWEMGMAVFEDCEAGNDTGDGNGPARQASETGAGLGPN